METQEQDRARTAIHLAPWQLQRAKELIAVHLGRSLTVAWLARECGLSRCHFSRAFQGSTGLSPHQWLTRARLDRARQLLLGERTVAEVAQACGFTDQAHFARVFVRHVGTPPSQWRLARLREQSGARMSRGIEHPAPRPSRLTCRSE